MASSADSKSGGFPKRDEFQRYLEKAGVIEQLTRLLVSLYETPEKPDNAMDFIQSYLSKATSSGADGSASVTSDGKAASERVAELEQEVAEKDAEIARLKAALAAATGADSASSAAAAAGGAGDDDTGADAAADDAAPTDAAAAEHA